MDEVPEFDFTPLTDAVERLQKVAQQYGGSVRQIIASNKIDPTLVSRLNRILMELEPSLLNAEGLPNRPWYRHQIWAPGINTGYSGFAFPGIHESLVSRDWKTAEQQIPVIASALNRFSDLLEQAIQASE